MKKILKLTFILFLVCAITAGVLGLINEMTYDRIQEQKRIKTEKAYAAVLASDGYEETAFDKAAFPTIDKVNKCTNGAGYVVTTTFSGAQGRITMAVGVDNELLCTGHFHHFPRGNFRPWRKCCQRFRSGCQLARAVRGRGRRRGHYQGGRQY